MHLVSQDALPHLRPDPSPATRNQCTPRAGHFQLWEALGLSSEDQFYDMHPLADFLLQRPSGFLKLVLLNSRVHSFR